MEDVRSHERKDRHDVVQNSFRNNSRSITDHQQSLVRHLWGLGYWVRKITDQYEKQGDVKTIHPQRTRLTMTSIRKEDAGRSDLKQKDDLSGRIFLFKIPLTLNDVMALSRAIKRVCET